jgi:hypothetical protein
MNKIPSVKMGALLMSAIGNSTISLSRIKRKEENKIKQNGNEGS